MKQILLVAALGAIAFAGSLGVGMLLGPHVGSGAEAVEEAAPPPDPDAVGGSGVVTTSARSASTLALRDSVDLLTRRLAEAERDLPALRARVAELEDQLLSRQRRQALVEDISQTLTRLEDRELGPIVQRLDFDTLVLLYETASARNRPRLLAAMPPDRAARFVDRMTGGPPSRALPEPAAEPLAPAEDAE